MVCPFGNDVNRCGLSSLSVCLSARFLSLHFSRLVIYLSAALSAASSSSTHALPSHFEKHGGRPLGFLERVGGVWFVEEFDVCCKQTESIVLFSVPDSIKTNFDVRKSTSNCTWHFDQFARSPYVRRRNFGS